MLELSSIQSKSLISLYIALITVVVTPICFLLFGSWLLWSNIEQSVWHDLEWRANLAAENADRIFETDALLLQRMQDVTSGWSDADIQNRTVELHRQLALLSLGVPRVRDLFILDANGNLLISSDSAAATLPTSITQDYFVAARSAHHGLLISQRLFNGIDAEFIVAIPRRDPDDTFIGVYGITMSAHYFETSYLESHLADLTGQRAIGLLRDDGTWLVRAPVPPMQYPDMNVTLIEANRMKRDQGRYETNTELRPHIVVFRKLSGAPIFVLASNTKGLLWHDWINNIIPHLFFGIPASLTMIVLLVVSLRSTRAAYASAKRLALEQERRQIAEQATAASRRMEAIGQLAGGIAHDFNNSLAVIQGHADLASRHPHRVERALETIIAASRRSSRMIQLLLGFARQKPVAPIVLDLNVETKRIITLVQSMLGNLIQVSLQINFASPQVSELDLNELEMAILNLLLNARDALPNGGLVTVAVTNCHENPQKTIFGAITLTIKDNGVGMSPTVIQRAFEPFFTTKHFGRGAGLGLAQVFAFARQSGGEARIFSIEGEGTRIEIIVPRCSPLAKIALYGDRLAAFDIIVLPLANQTEHRSGPFRVLLVEDNLSVAEIISELLRDIGCMVWSVENAQIALAHLGEADSLPDLLLSDVRLPGRTGLELAIEVTSRWPVLPMVLMTGYSEQLIDSTWKGTVLRKPVNRADLVEVIATIQKSYFN